MDTFSNWYHSVFRNDPLYVRMSSEVENSPWHREANVGVHTDMVVSAFLDNFYNLIPNRLTANVIAIALAFHDTGKPYARVEKFSEERGNYRSFGGHELISARLWEDWAATHWDSLVTTFNMVPYDIYRIAWLIENHLPYGLRKENKLNNLRQTAVRVVDSTWGFMAMLMSDTIGRISDDHETKVATTQQWCVDNLIIPMDTSVLDMKKVLYLPITTKEEKTYQLFVDRLSDGGEYKFDVLPLDDVNQNPAFVRALKSHNAVYVYGKNLTRKTRRFFVDTARNNNFTVVAILCPSTMDSCLSDRVYMSVQMPSYGEVDRVDVYV